MNAQDAIEKLRERQLAMTLEARKPTTIHSGMPRPTRWRLPLEC